MSELYIFEAGATRTDVLCLSKGSRLEKTLPGYNPNRSSVDFENALKKDFSFSNESVVFFYGSGLGNEVNKDVVRQMFSSLDTGQVRIHDDIIGAARAAYNRQAGIICIMGTGGLAAYYNGRDIVKRRGGYGYLVNDLGGGFELGKRILTAWLNEDLNANTQQQLLESSKMSAAELLASVYKENDLNKIAALSKVAAELKDEKLEEIVLQYFRDFVKENVCPLAAQFQLSSFSIIGGLSTAYHHYIRAAAKEFDLKIEQCIQRPIQRLLDFHLSD